MRRASRCDRSESPQRLTPSEYARRRSSLGSFTVKKKKLLEDLRSRLNSLASARSVQRATNRSLALFIAATKDGKMSWGKVPVRAL